MSWREIACGLVGAIIALLLVSLVIQPRRAGRGAVYEIPIIKEEKGLKAPSGVYRVTTYKGKAYLMIELPPAGGNEDGR